MVAEWIAAEGAADNGVNLLVGLFLSRRRRW